MTERSDSLRFQVSSLDLTFTLTSDEGPFTDGLDFDHHWGVPSQTVFCLVDGALVQTGRMH